MPEVDVEIKVTDLEDTTLGICTIYPNNSLLKIVIDKSLLDHPRLRKMVIYHELIHCVFDVDHYENDIDLMNANSKHEEEILRNFPYYVKKTLERVRMEKFLESIKK